MDTRTAVGNYFAAFDNPNGQGNAIIAGVPTPPSNALLRYGDTVLIPGLPSSLDDLMSSTASGIGKAAELAAAFPPTYEAGVGVNALAKLVGGAGRFGPRAPAQSLDELRAEVGALTARGRQIGVSPGQLPDVAMSPEHENNVLRFVRDTMKPRIAAAEARNAAAPRTSVPNTDGITPIRERNAVLDTLQGNPYVQPIPGRQGFPTKAEQVDLANRYFEAGGRLGPAGPWGRNMVEEIRNLLAEAAKTKPGPGSQ